MNIDIILIEFFTYLKYMKFYKIKKRENSLPIFIANPMVSSFKKPKLPLILVKVKNPIKPLEYKGFIVEELDNLNL